MGGTAVSTRFTPLTMSGPGTTARQDLALERHQHSRPQAVPAGATRPPGASQADLPTAPPAATETVKPPKRVPAVPSLVSVAVRRPALRLVGGRRAARRAGPRRSARPPRRSARTFPASSSTTSRPTPTRWVRIRYRGVIGAPSRPSSAPCSPTNRGSLPVSPGPGAGAVLAGHR